jgi:serine/threonine protein kinase/WD40 repeat protein
MQRKLIADRFILIERLGSGGMGVVWRARDKKLKRDVALKQVIPQTITTDSARLVQRLLREAQAGARIHHENVVKIHNWFVDGDGVFWIDMEYVKGTSLDILIKSKAPLPIAQVAAIGLGVAAALEAAHAGRIVHRDVKPSNILLGPKWSADEPEQDRVVLTDFGIALVHGEQRLTDRKPVGTTAYMSPEQKRDSSRVTYSTDVWSLGVTLFEMVEGRLPYTSHSPGSPVGLDVRHAALLPLLRDLLQVVPEDRPPIPQIRARLEDLVRVTVPDVPRRMGPPRPPRDPSVDRPAEPRVRPPRPAARPSAEPPPSRRQTLKNAGITVATLAGLGTIVGGSVWLADWYQGDLGGAQIRLPPDGDERIATMAYAPNGDLLATGSADGAVRLWHPRTGHQVFMLGRHDGGVSKLAFSKRADVLASAGSDGEVRLWNVDLRKPLPALPGHRTGVDLLAFSGHDHLAVADRAGAVMLWDIRSKQPPRIFPGGHGRVGVLVFSPDPNDSLLAFVQCGRVRLWHAAAHRPQPPLPHAAGETTTLAFTSDGTMLATGEGSRIRLWRLPRAALARTLGGPEDDGGRVNILAFAPGDSFLAAGYTNHQATLWRVETGDAINPLRHKGSVSMLAFNRGDLLATGGPDDGIKLWDWRDGGANVQNLRTDDRPLDLAFDRRGRQLAIIEESGAVKLHKL